MADRKMPECPACGHPFTRLCACGATFHALDDGCRACGRVSRRRLQRSSGLLSGVSRGVGTFVEGLGAPFRAVAAGIRDIRGRPGPGRDSCTDCGAAVSREDRVCPSCERDLTAECRCGARYHRHFDRRCPVCGNDPRHRRRRPAGLLLLLAVVLAATVMVLVFGGPGHPGGDNPVTVGYDAYARGDDERAVAAFQEHLSAHPADAQTRYAMGVALHRLGRDVDARLEVERAHRDAPALEDPIVFLAKRWLEAKRLDAAVPLLEEAVRLRPPSARACLLLGRLLYSRGSRAKAAELLAVGLESAAEPPPVEETLLLAEHVAVSVPGSDRAEQENRARRLFERARAWIELDDASDPGLLARAHLGLSNGPEAVAAARQALQRAGPGDRAGSLLLLARALGLAGDGREAVERVGEALATDSRLDTLRAAADLYAVLGHPELARSTLLEAVEAFPGNDELLARWAEVRRREGAGAALAAEIASRAGSRAGGPAVVALRARAMAEAGDHDGVAKLLAGAERDHPGDRILALARIRALLEEVEDRSDAVPDACLVEIAANLDRLRRSDPFDSEAVVLSGRVSLLRGREREALMFAEDALFLDPENLDAAVAEGLALAAGGEWNDAADRLAVVMSRAGERPDPDAVTALARCFVELSLPARAIDLLEGLLRRLPGEAGARTLIISILVDAGRRDEAATWVEAGADGAPASLETVVAGAYRSLERDELGKARAALLRARVFVRTPEEERVLSALRLEIERRAPGGRRSPAAHPGEISGLVSGNGVGEARFLRGDVLLGSGRPEDAARDYTLQAAGDPADLATLRRAFEAGLAAGADDVAATAAAAARADSSGDISFYLDGRLGLSRGDIAEAIRLLTEYASRRPSDAQGRYAAASVLMDAGRLDEAVDHAVAALELSPWSSPARTLLAELVQMRMAEIFMAGDLPGALFLVDRLPIPAPRPETEAALPTAAILAVKNLCGSAEECSDAVRRRPGSVAARRVLGLSRMADGRPDEAAAIFLAVVRDGTPSAYDRFLLAAALFEAGKGVDAEAWAREAMEAAGHPLFAADLAVSIALAREAGEVAERAIRRMAAERKGDPRVLTLLGRVLASRGKLRAEAGATSTGQDVADDARGNLTRVARSDPLDIWAPWLLIRSELASYGKPGDVISQAVLRLDEMRGRPELEYQLAWLEHGWGTAARAEEHARWELDRHPENIRARRLLARVALDAGDPADAISILSSASIATPRDPETSVLLAEAHLAANLAGQALEEYRHTLEACPRYLPALIGFADLRLDAPGAWREVRPLISRGMETASDDPALLLLMGRARLAAGDDSGASALVGRALDGLKRQRLVLRVLTDPFDRVWLPVRKARQREVDDRIAAANAVNAAIRRHLEGR